jgi:putative membrane protein
MLGQRYFRILDYFWVPRGEGMAESRAASRSSFSLSKGSVLMRGIRRGRGSKAGGITLAVLVGAVLVLSMRWIFAQTIQQSSPPPPPVAVPPPLTPEASTKAPGAGTQASSAKSGNHEADSVLQNFLTHAYYHGRAEVYLAQMASTRAVSPEVKQFAGTVIADRGHVDHELFDLAKKKGVKVEVQYRVEENPLYQAMLTRLGQLSGPDFDVAYLQQTAENHSLELAQYLHLAQEAPDSETQLFAAQQVSRVRDRLRRLRQILRASEHQVTARAL